MFALLGQSVALEHLPSDARQLQLNSGYNALLAQGLEDQNADVPKTEPNRSTPEGTPVESGEPTEQTPEKAPNNSTQPPKTVDSENGETPEKTHTAWEKNATDFQDC